MGCGRWGAGIVGKAQPVQRHTRWVLPQQHFCGGVDCRIGRALPSLAQANNPRVRMQLNDVLVQSFCCNITVVGRLYWIGRSSLHGHVNPVDIDAYYFHGFHFLS